MTVVVFNPQAFLARYPEFALLDQAAVVSASVIQNSAVMTINSVTNGTVAVGETVSGSNLVVPNTIPLADTIASFGSFTGSGTGTVNLSAPALVTANNLSLTLYMWNLLTQYFNEACLYLNNTDGSKVTDITLRTTMLNMITAHIAQLNLIANGVVANPLVGRITSASEGSVHVTVEDGKPSAYAAWFKQTQYGNSYWQISAQYRRMRYLHPHDNPNYDLPRGGF